MQICTDRYNCVKRRRYEQDEAREDNLRARTQTYVTEGCHSATTYCEVYTSVLLVVLLFAHHNLNGRTREIIGTANGVFKITLIREVQKPFVVYV